MNLCLAIDILRKTKDALTYNAEKLNMLKNKSKKLGKKNIKYPLFKIYIEYSKRENKFEFTPNAHKF